MKAKEWRQKADEELDADEKELRKELFNLRFQSATENLENPRRIREIRRDIARIDHLATEEAGIVMDAATEQLRLQRRKETGVVTSDSMQKTISVAADRLVRHPKYGKYLRRTTIYKAHDEKGEAKLGDRVEIVMTRPLSRTKRWRLVRVIEKARGDKVAVGVREEQ